jgi:hypothetical protein
MPKLSPEERARRAAAEATMWDAMYVNGLIIDARFAQGPDVVWLDLVMPNGKPLRECTYGELDVIVQQIEAAQNAAEAAKDAADDGAA